MKLIFPATLMVILALASLSSWAQQSATPKVETPDGAATPNVADKDTLRKAFDGAMTCSAITAVMAADKGPDERWLWDNRSFAFGMLAARFYQDASGEQMTAELLDNALNQYAGRVVDMEAGARQGFEKSCEGKYGDIDKLCEINTCLHSGPPGTPAAE